MILNLLIISDEFVAMFRDKTGYPIVEPAHMVCSYEICIGLWIYLFLHFEVQHL